MINLSRSATRLLLRGLCVVLTLAGTVGFAWGTIRLFYLFRGLGTPAMLLSAVVSLIAYLAALYQLWQGFNERLSEFLDSEHPFRRFVMFGSLASVGLCCGVLCVVASLNIGQLLWTDRVPPLDRLTFAIFHVLAPLMAPGVFVLLATKVRMARTLDIQKRNIREMASALNKFEFPEAVLSASGTPGRPLTKDDVSTYVGMLEEICGRALMAASVAGTYATSEIMGGAAVLFLADTKAEDFVPVAVAGASPAYKRALKEFRPPFWSAEKFRKIYNRHVKTAETKKVRKDELLRQFRDETKTLVSVTGVVFEVQRPLVFDADRKTHPLMFRDELFENVAADQRPNFRQVVGVPIIVCERKIGVLLLLGNREHSFYRNDTVYGTAGDVVAVAVKLGTMFGYFAGFGFGDGPLGTPLAKKDAELETAVRILNTVQSDFRQPC